MRLGKRELLDKVCFLAPRDRLSCDPGFDSLCFKVAFSFTDCNEKSGWKLLTLSSLKGCYRLSDKRRTWDEASRTCNKDNANLASILNDDEQIMISQVNNLPHDPYELLKQVKM